MSTHKSTTSTQDDLTKHSQPTTQRDGALSPMPSYLGIGGHTGGSPQGHPRYTSAHKVGRPWGPKRTTRKPKTRGLPSSMVAEHVTTNHSAHDKMLKKSPKDKPNNKLEQNKITKFSKEQDVKYQEQESSGLKKSAGELTSDRDSANAELSAVVQYTKLNDSDVDKTTMYRDESEHRGNSNSIGAGDHPGTNRGDKQSCLFHSSECSSAPSNELWMAPSLRWLRLFLKTEFLSEM